ncbi:hypothetical protein A2U01_0061885, partial [Trifolium medium]|nr:hypothetical protein [Trifolium medium]
GSSMGFDGNESVSWKERLWGSSYRNGLMKPISSADVDVF